jgi:Antibiotic biosynthesis monooxygenase
VIAVIFEARAHPDRRQAYLDLAERLRPLLQEVDGFLSIERFESLSEPGKEAGRRSIFAAYRPRVAHVVRDYGM